MKLSPGQLLGGRFRLERLLGRGGMGQVWAATHEVTEQRHAIKLLNSEHESEALRRRFLREARAASRVKHPNVIDVQDVFALESGTPVMVMDLLEGETLREVLHREESLRVADVAGLMLPVLSAVQAAHDAGVIHRDLKPENIFVCSDSEGAARLRVLDFGLAKIGQTSGEGQTTATGQILGTPLYMSPEQLLGEATIDAATDVWALGVILYEALSGGRPIEASHPGKMLEAILERGHAPLEQVLPHVPQDLADVIEGALSRAGTERPSIDAIADVLRAHATSPDVVLRPATAPTSSRKLEWVTTELTPPTPPPRDKRTAYVLVGGAMLAAGVIAAVSLSSGESTARPGAETAASASPAPSPAPSSEPSSVVSPSVTAPSAAPPPAQPTQSNVVPRPGPHPRPVRPPPPAPSVAPAVTPSYGGGVLEEPPD